MFARKYCYSRWVENLKVMKKTRAVFNKYTSRRTSQCEGFLRTYRSHSTFLTFLYGNVDEVIWNLVNLVIKLEIFEKATIIITLLEIHL